MIGLPCVDLMIVYDIICIKLDTIVCINFSHRVPRMLSGINSWMCPIEMNRGAALRSLHRNLLGVRSTRPHLLPLSTAYDL